MNVQQFFDSLSSAGDAAIRFQLPSGELIPDHFHVTEVGRVDKNFIDCGGTRRHAASCLLQTWTASDFDHRLHASKLAKIIKMAAPILGPFDLPVEVEFGVEAAVQYAVTDVQKEAGSVIFILKAKQTDCLAKDQCGVGGCGTTSCCN